MPVTPHIEKHFTAGDAVRDVVIGMSDGLTVPFALAAGPIAMGLGGYLAARSDAEHYASELVREAREIVEVPEMEATEVADVFRGYGLSDVETAPILAAFRQRPEAWRDFMMRFELGLERPDPRRALRSALTIAGAYAVGGMVPLLPYFFTGNVQRGLLISAVTTSIALLVFGYIKARFTGAPAVRGALQTVFIGGLAATAAFLIARVVS